MKEGKHSLWIALLMGLLLAGCAKQQPVQRLAPSQEPTSRCPGIFVLAPTDYMRYMDEEEPVLLASEGRAEDLPVYCTREEAQADLEKMTASGDLVPGLWRPYRLEGVWEADVVENEPGCCRMRRPAGLADASTSRSTRPDQKAALAHEAEDKRTTASR